MGRKPAEPPIGPPIVTAVEKSIIQDIKDKLSATGAVGYRIRVTKKGPSGYQYRGWLDSLDGIEDAIQQKWGDGFYSAFCHLADNRRVDGVPPFSFTIGDAEAALRKDMEAAHGPALPPGQSQDSGGNPGPSLAFIPGVGVRSKRLATLEEEIEALRREKELRRAQRELRRFEEEEGAENGKEVDKLERRLEQLQKDRDDTLKRLEGEKVTDHIKRLEAQIVQKPTMDPEKEALKVRLADMERERKTSEIAALKAGFDAQITVLKTELDRGNRAPSWNMKDIVPLVAPVIAAITAYLQSAKSRQAEMLEAIKLLKDTMGGGMSMKDLLPLVTPLLQQKGPDLSAIFSMVSDIVSPMVEAAAQAATNPPSSDDVGGMIKGLLGQIGKATEQAQAVQAKTAEAERTKAAALLAMSQRRTAAQQQPQAAQAPPAPPQPPRTKKRREGATPVARFAMYAANAIRTRNEDFDEALDVAESELTQRDLDTIMGFQSVDALVGYMSAHPGVNSEAFQTKYGRSWLKELLDAMRGGDSQEEAEEEPEAPSEPEPKAEVLRYKQRIAEPNEFKYPADSVLVEKEVEGIVTKVEFPTAATVAKREEERRKMEEDFKKFREKQAAPALTQDGVEKEQ